MSQGAGIALANCSSPHSDTPLQTDSTEAAGHHASTSNSTATSISFYEGPLGSELPPTARQQSVPGTQQNVDDGTVRATTALTGADVADCIHAASWPGTGSQRTAAGYHHSSAYFPAEQQDFKHSTATETCVQSSAGGSQDTARSIHNQQPALPQQHPAAAEVPQASLQQGVLHQQVQEHHHHHHQYAADLWLAGRHAGPHGASMPDPKASADHNGGHAGEDISASESPSSSSSQSAVSELLDSEDLEELAGLCDGLISQASRQRLATAAVQHSVPNSSSLTAAAAAGRPVAGNNLYAASDPGSMSAEAAVRAPWQQPPLQASQHTGDQRQYHHQHGEGQHVQSQQPPQQQTPTDLDSTLSQHSQRKMSVMQALTADLHRLQQQLAAAGFDHGSKAAAVGAALAASTGSNSMAAPMRIEMHGGFTESSGHHDNAAAAILQAAAANRGPGTGMADLQQQLAARMAEVKQRLSNICNGMMEEAMTAGGPAAGSCTVAAAAGASAEPYVQGYGPLQGHWPQQQQAQQQPSAASTSPAGFYPSARQRHAAGRLQPQHQAADGHRAMGTGKVPPLVAVEVHASGHAVVDGAPSGGTSVGFIPGCSDLRSLNRVKVGGPALWSAAKGSAAATAAGEQITADRSNRAAPSSVMAPAFISSCDGSGGGVSAAASAEDDSESSWATVEGDEEEAEQQQQQQSRQQQSQGQDSHHRQEYLQAPQQPVPHFHPNGAPPVNRLLQTNKQYSLFSSDADSDCHGFQTPPSEHNNPFARQGVQQQQNVDIENDGRNEQARQQRQQPTMVSSAQYEQQCQTPVKQQHGAPVSGAVSQQNCSWGASPTIGGDGARSGGMQQGNSDGPWQQQHQRTQRGVSESLEGVLFGLKGRVAAEVSQTFSPLKAAGAAGVYTIPSSPVTPLRPRNI